MKTKHMLCCAAAISLVAISAVAERLTLTTNYATCTVETRGARILSYRPKGAEEVIWNAEPMQVDAPVWAHGGIPTVWPWFGVNGKVEIHGTAWKRDFAVVSKRETKYRSELVMALDDGKVRLEYTVRLGDSLKLEMKTENHGKEPYAFCAGFHPYFRVGDVTKATVGGVKPNFEASAFTKPISFAKPIDDVYPVGPGSCEVYRLADPVLDRTIFVFSENSTDVNVWNPGAPKDTPGFIPGDSWRQFACVEPMIGTLTKPYTVAPGDYVTLMMGIEVRRGSKLSGFASADPRLPGAADAPTGRPFHVLYIGAHPDDLDYDFGASAAKLVSAGAKVTAISVTDGSKGHAWMTSEALAARRLKEAQSSGRVYGCERYIVLEAHDCELDVSRRWRERLGRLVRDIAPDLVFTHRNVDYHADHRAVGQNVQDLTYFLGVPLWCPDTPVPSKLPFFMYAVDGFTLPRRLRPDLVMSGDGAFDVMARGLSCHASQVFEWLPPESDVDPATLSTSAVRDEYAKKLAIAVYRSYSKPYADLLKSLYGRSDEPVTIAELSEYSRRPTAAEVEFLSSIPGFKWCASKPTKSDKNKKELKPPQMR